MNPTIYEQSIDTQVLIERLSEMQEGDVLTYDALSEAIGRNVTREARHILGSARRFVEREHAIFTDTISKTGIKRITPAQVVQGAPKQTKRKMHNASNRLIRKLSNTPDELLTPEDLRRKRSEIAIQGTLRMFTKPATQEAVMAQINDHQSLPVGSILDIVRKAK